MNKLKVVIQRALQPKTLLIFVGLLACGLVVSGFVQLFQVSSIDYAAVKWQIFWTFALVIIFIGMWFYTSIMTD